jgi:capsular polysaccharide biosynthesis protein
MEIELKDYIRILRKRMVLIIAMVLALTMTTAIVSVFVMKPVYEASTKIIVTKSEKNNALQQVDVNTINTNIQLINTYKEIIKTPRIMDLVVSQYPEFNLTATELTKIVEVSSVNQTQVMTLKVQDTSYKRAADIVNATSEVFRDEIPTIMQVDNVSILNQANTDLNPAPVRPNKLLNVAIAFVVSLMLGVGVAFVLEYLDDTIKSEDDIMKIMNLPTLTMIGKIQQDDLISKSKRRKQGEGVEDGN